MASKVIFDAAKVANKIKRCARTAESAVADQIIADSRQYVPADDEGTLRDSARVETNGDGTQVTYNTPYAAYQYYGCYPDGSHVITQHTTAGTRTQWLEYAKSLYNEKWLRVAQNAFKELG